VNFKELKGIGSSMSWGKFVFSEFRGILKYFFKIRNLNNFKRI
jgi:hypothetical protein